MNEIVAFLQLGGPLMFVIAFGSLVATTVFFERIWSLQRRRIVPEHLKSLVLDRLRSGAFDEAKGLCDASPSPLADVLRAGIDQAGAPRARVREALEDRGRHAAASLERYLGVIGSVATVSPLLGLLGTITGMIKTFQQVTENAQASGVNAGLLANGIWEALVTTAAGLSVAIPAYLAHRYLTGRVDRLIGELEEAALLALDPLAAPDETE